MKHTIIKRKPWEAMLREAQHPIQLAVAHDALTARLIELAGFDAYQIGGYALSGASHAIPDVDLEKLGEKKYASEAVWVSPKYLHHIGYTTILYPITIIFQVIHAFQKGLKNLKKGKASAWIQYYDG